MRIKARALGFGGECVCVAVDESEQKIIFVPGLIPGEIADVRVVKEEKNLLIAQLESIIEPSPMRRSPPCKYFGRCGGCNLQHMEIVAQRSSKHLMIESMLLKHGGIAPLEGVVSLSESLPEFHYRKRITLHLNKRGEVGFFKAASNDIIPIDECLIASHSVNSVLSSIKPHLPSICKTIDAIEIDVKDDSVRLILNAGEYVYRPDVQDNYDVFAPLLSIGEVSFRIRDKDYSLKSGSIVPIDATEAGQFSQVNPYGNDQLVQSVISGCKTGTVTELYSGAGNFSFPLVEAGCLLTAVELNPALVAVGRERAYELKVKDKISFVTMSCEKYVYSHTLNPTVILDPPRTGAKEVVLKANWDGVGQIIYVSCDLPSLTRDLKVLAASGYVVRRVEFIDMFPQTHHVELIAWLDREG